LEQDEYYSYTLTVEGLDGIVFNESALVDLNRKSSSVLFQTDKAQYKPGDKVQFRILVVDKDTKPLDLSKKTVRVWINNPSGNKIKEWSDVKIPNGVFKGELKLAREPELGHWTLNLDFNSEKKQYRSNVSIIS
jgi:CD109 antigen